ncbi:TetR/AcrR family transcriptional regulator [Methylocapsa palsarum]|uniref:Regulatory protein, tetR family n=1 Tax=Methylocapsa palsarum TaxID=1612308 RepID=A0A1I3Z2I8_9HYPH|nr:TetR/AcrR family transcriptional regulator [Methylocapsa palsarum]SFK38298.1 regulatory protein, tetR family [Methylocapsa palsarum]
MVDQVKSESDPLGLAPPPKDARKAIIDALLELAGERNWEDITISDIAARANVSLSTFREFFPSKGAILASFSRNIDKLVLDTTGDDLAGEPAKERLFDVLMRRLDVLTPYKAALEGVAEWARKDPLGASAINQVNLNSMRFMLEASGIDSEGPVGAIKLQGLVLAWRRILNVWFHDDDPGLASTMAALDRELTKGGKFVARAEDLNRLVSPLFSLARAVFIPRGPDHHGAGAQSKDASASS